MKYLRYALYAPLGLAFNIFAFLTAFFWAFWAAAFNLDRLPGPFAWIHTHDDTIYGDGWLKYNGYSHPDSFVERWKTATWWIMRNPGYGFAAYVLGCKVAGEVFLTQTSRGADQFDIGAYRSYFVTWKDAKGREYFAWRMDLPWLGFFVKFWIGWNYTSNDGKTHMLKVMCNPFRSVGK